MNKITIYRYEAVEEGTGVILAATEYYTSIEALKEAYKGNTDG